MSRLICKFQVVGPVQTNCYFLYREDTKDCVIVDPGATLRKPAMTPMPWPRRTGCRSQLTTAVWPSPLPAPPLCTH